MENFPMYQTCEICGDKTLTRTSIDKQTPHGYVRLMVCEKCAANHANYLVSLQQNFKTQFGEK